MNDFQCVKKALGSGAPRWDDETVSPPSEQRFTAYIVLIRIEVKCPHAALIPVFNTTGLERIYLKTLNWNQRAQKCFRKCGFAKYGELTRGGYDFFLMEIRRSEWLDIKNGSREADSDTV